MQVETPELSYHNDIKPVLAVDIHPSGRMATGGADHMVRIWHLQQRSGVDGGAAAAASVVASPPVASSSRTDLTFLANLDFHEQPVNAVRFSPDGSYLASASDDNWVVIWQRVDGAADAAASAAAGPSAGAADAAPLAGAAVDLTGASPVGEASATATAAPSLPFGADPDDVIESKEKWVQFQRMRGHVSEIYDLCWSPNSKELLTGSIDHHALVWSLTSNSFIQILKDHSGYVQGVSWDPLNQYLATQSSDRSVKIYERKRNMRSKSTKPLIEFVEKCTVRNRKMPRLANKEECNQANTNGNATATTPKKKLQPMSLQLDGVVDVSDAAVEGQENQTPLNVAHIVAQSIAEKGANGDAGSSPKKEKEKTPSSTITRSLFMDDAYPSYFRRLAFSPDGSFLVAPAGQFHVDELASDAPSDPSHPSLLAKVKSDASVAVLDSIDGGSTAARTSLPTCYVFHRSDFSKPIAHLPQIDPVVCVKFCPKLFQLRPSSSKKKNETKEEMKEPLDEDEEEDEESTTTLPYRMVFAVATTKHILLYDTESSFPLCVIKNVHHSGLTDLAWSADGMTIISASSDGYCSYVYLGQDKPEIGDMLPEEEMSEYRAWWGVRRDQFAASLLADDGGDADKKKKRKTAAAGGEAKTAIVALLGAEPAPLPSWVPPAATSEGGASSTNGTTTSATPTAPSKAAHVMRPDAELYRHALELLANGERLTPHRMQIDCGSGPKRCKKIVSDIDALTARTVNQVFATAGTEPPSAPKQDFEEVLATALGVDVGVNLRTVVPRPRAPPIPYSLTKAPKVVVSVPAALDALPLAVAPTAASPNDLTVPAPLVAGASSDPIVIDSDVSASPPAPSVPVESSNKEPAAAPVADSTPGATASASASTPAPASASAPAPASVAPVSTPVASTLAVPASPAKLSSPPAALRTPASPAQPSQSSPVSTPARPPSGVVGSGGAAAASTTSGKRKRKADDSASKPKTTIMDMFRKAAAVAKTPTSDAKKKEETNKPAASPVAAAAVPASAVAASTTAAAAAAAAAADIVDLTATNASLGEAPVSQPRVKRRITPQIVQDTPPPPPSSLAALSAPAVVPPPAPAAVAASSAVSVSSGSDSDSDSDSSSVDDVEYTVEKILKKRTSVTRGVEYLVKWLGYDSSSNSWEPEDNLNCEEAIEKFEKSQKTKRRVAPTLITSAVTVVPAAATAAANATTPAPHAAAAAAEPNTAQVTAAAAPAASTAAAAPAAPTASVDVPPSSPFLASINAATSISSLSPSRKRKAAQDEEALQTAATQAPSSDTGATTNGAPVTSSSTTVVAGGVAVHQPEVKKKQRKITPQVVPS